MRDPLRRVIAFHCMHELPRCRRAKDVKEPIWNALRNFIPADIAISHNIAGLGVHDIDDIKALSDLRDKYNVDFGRLVVSSKVLTRDQSVRARFELFFRLQRPLNTVIEMQYRSGPHNTLDEPEHGRNRRTFDIAYDLFDGTIAKVTGVECTLPEAAYLLLDFDAFIRRLRAIEIKAKYHPNVHTEAVLEDCIPDLSLYHIIGRYSSRVCITLRILSPIPFRYPRDRAFFRLIARLLVRIDGRYVNYRVGGVVQVDEEGEGSSDDHSMAEQTSFRTIQSVLEEYIEDMVQWALTKYAAR